MNSYQIKNAKNIEYYKEGKTILKNDLKKAKIEKIR
jgi:hypothetical protein